MSELDDLVRKRRFEEIHEARQQVIQDKRQLDDAVASGKASDSLARRLYQRSIDRYVQELETLLNPPGQGEDEENIYWTEVRIGTVNLPGDEVKTVDGLLEFLELDEEIEVRVRVQSDARYFEVSQPEVQTITVQPSWGILQSAFRTANAALADIGMELRPNEKSDLYAIKRDPDDYPEPSKNGIKKPQ